jgi:hypothetical protein
VELLDQRDIRHSSVDLVRFSWVEDNKDVEENADDEDTEEIEENVDDEDIEDVEENVNDEDVDIKIAPYGTVITTPVTMGVLPDTLTGEVTFHSSNDILDLLKEHEISDIDVAYRESVARGFSGPELFAPVSNFDPLKAVIDPLTTALGLPVAGLKTLKSQGTMGFYFRDLYAVTTRHVLFPEDEGNNSYSYVGTFSSSRR